MTYKIVITGFLVYNKLEKIQFFENTFLLANISIKMILKIFFSHFLLYKYMVCREKA